MTLASLYIEIPLPQEHVRDPACKSPIPAYSVDLPGDADGRNDSAMVKDRRFTPLLAP